MARCVSPALVSLRVLTVKAAHSQISAISAQDDNILATSFGPSPVLIHSPIDMQGGGCTISRPEKATDVTSSLLLPGGGIVLGASGSRGAGGTLAVAHYFFADLAQAARRT